MHVAPIVSLLLRLKSETRPHHERTEAAVRLMEPTLSLDGYRRHLEALYGFYLPLEPLLARRLEGDVPSLRMGERRKVPLLARDLEALGHDASALECLARCARTPDVTDLPEALGCLYVLEGSTLGGQLILRHLRKHFADAPVGEFAFFSAYGDQVGPMWRAFGEALLRAAGQAASEDFDARVVEGARNTFDAFGGWLRQETDETSLDD